MHLLDNMHDLIGGSNYDDHVAFHNSHDGHSDYHPIGFLNDDGSAMVALDDYGGMHFSGADDHLGNIDTILSHLDPLAHSHDYHCHHFDMGDHINPHLVHVNSYMRSDGTIVDCHFRTEPDGILDNNLSYHK